MNERRSLSQLGRQTGVYVSTLRRTAEKLYGKHRGLFTEDECAEILKHLVNPRTIEAARRRVNYNTNDNHNFASFANYNQTPVNHNFASFAKDAKDANETQNYNQTPVSGNTIQLSSDVVKALDNLLQFKIPHYRDCPNHLAALTTFLTAAGNKGKVAYDKDLIEARQLAEEYNQWVDSQL